MSNIHLKKNDFNFMHTNSLFKLEIEPREISMKFGHAQGCSGCDV